VSHIALLIPTLDRIGGAERQVMLLGAGLQARGWRVSVAALAGTGGDAAGELAARGIDFLSLEMRRGLVDARGWLRLHGWLRRERPEIVHAHMPHAAWMARWSRLAVPVRVVVDTIHTSATGTAGRRLGYRVSQWLPDRVTGVSEAVREAYMAAGMVTERQCVVVPNGLDMEAWKPDKEARAEHRYAMGLSDEVLWFAAGRLEAVKDYETMLCAFAQTPERGVLAIAGVGPMESKLRQLAVRLGVADRVRFLGFVSDVRPWLQAADGFVLTSRWEGLPMGLIEAAACGLPAVATDVAGSREVVMDGETGWLAPAGDAKAISAKMQLLMKTPLGERLAMGDLARQRAHERYSLPSVSDRWEALYRKLLERNPRPRRWAPAG
jgi:glycosyltransferase involved in cell wall biosynthesis